MHIFSITRALIHISLSLAVLGSTIVLGAPSDDDLAQTTVQRAPALEQLAAGKNEFELGHLTWLRTDEHAEIKIEALKTDPATQTVQSSRIAVAAGRVWLGNYIYGNTITLYDERIAVENSNGAILFEKQQSTSDTATTKITSIGATSQLRLRSSESSEAFASQILSPGQSVTLTDADLGKLEAATTDERKKLWQSLLGTENFGSEVFVKTNLAADRHALGQIAHTWLASREIEPANATWQTIRKTLLVLPAAKNRFLQAETAQLIGAVEPAQAKTFWHNLEQQVGSANATERASLRAAFATLVPLARLAPGGIRTPEIELVSAELAPWSDEIANLGGITPLDLSISSAQKIELALFLRETNPELSAQLTAQFIAQVESAPGELSDTLLAKNLTRQLTEHPKFIKPELIGALRTLTAGQNFEPLLELGLALVEQNELSAAATIAAALEQSEAVKSTALANLQNRLAYAREFPGQEFHLEAFTAWDTARAAAEAEAAAQPELTERLELVKVIKALNDGRISRPNYATKKALVPMTDLPTETITETAADIEHSAAELAPTTAEVLE
jgi:hypothetical protein